MSKSCKISISIDLTRMAMNHIILYFTVDTTERGYILFMEMEIMRYGESRCLCEMYLADVRRDGMGFSLISLLNFGACFPISSSPSFPDTVKSKRETEGHSRDMKADGDKSGNGHCDRNCAWLDSTPLPAGPLLARQPKLGWRGTGTALF